CYLLVTANWKRDLAAYIEVLLQADIQMRDSALHSPF
ncbi:MAG: hypothetical protein ACJAQ6_002430, partial [Arenicella sp.]